MGTVGKLEHQASTRKMLSQQSSSDSVERQKRCGALAEKWIAVMYTVVGEFSGFCFHQIFYEFKKLKIFIFEANGQNSFLDFFKVQQIFIFFQDPKIIISLFNPFKNPDSAVLPFFTKFMIFRKRQKVSRYKIYLNFGCQTKNCIELCFIYIYIFF